MRLLLDSNILVPILNGATSSLPVHIKQLIGRGDHSFFLSAASLWEIAIKVRLGKLPLLEKVEQLPTRAQKLGLIELPVTFAHGIALALPEPPTRDPFDRLLLAQCACEGLRLVTVDRALAAHPLAWSVDA